MNVPVGRPIPSHAVATILWLQVERDKMHPSYPMRTLAMTTLVLVLTLPAAAQRRGAGATTGPAAFAVMVIDPSGAPITDAKVTMTGPVQRVGSTEAGRIAFEQLPTGNYHFKFERDGYEPVEQDAVGRRGAPADVKATMTPKPKPVETLPPPPPAPPRPPRNDASPVVLAMPAFIEQNYVGRGSARKTPMACGPGGSSTLIQINESMADHSHAEADEFIYVIAGEGVARLGTRQEPLGPGVFVMIPRGTTHGFVPGRKKPLVFVSTLAGDKCS